MKLSLQLIDCYPSLLRLAWENKETFLNISPIHSRAKEIIPKDNFTRYKEIHLVCEF